MKIRQPCDAANGGWAKPTATLSLIQALAMLTLGPIASTGNTIVTLNVVAFGALIIVVIDLAIRLAL